MSSGKVIEIQQLLMAKSGTYNMQYRRPYETVGSAHAVNLISERMDQLQGNVKSISGGYLAGIAGDFVRPQAQPDAGSGIIIPNGWGTERYYFFMKVRVTNKLGLEGSTTELIQGYTDHPDMLSHGGALDPNTRFTINSVTTLKDTIAYDQYQGHNVSQLKESYHVVSNNAWSDITQIHANGQQLFTTMRPGDIYTTLNRQNMEVNGDIADMRTISTKMPRSSRRSNNISTEYASRTINGMIGAASKAMFGGEDPDLYSSAAGLVMEETLQQNAFMHAISYMNNMPSSDSFTLQDLFRLDPQLAHSSDQRMVVMTGGAATAQPNMQTSLEHRAEYSENWGGSTYEHLAATIISNAIVGLMIEAGLSVAHVQCTNHNHGGPIIMPRDGQTLGGQNLQQAMFAFQTRLQAEVLDQVSQRNSFSYNIEIRGEIARATMISIQMENRPSVVFVAPSFADALTAPILATDPTRLDAVAFDFGNMLGAVIKTATPSLEALTNMDGGFGNL